MSRLDQQIEWAKKYLNTRGFENESEVDYKLAHVVTVAEREIRKLRVDLANSKRRENRFRFLPDSNEILLDSNEILL